MHVHFWGEVIHILLCGELRMVKKNMSSQHEETKQFMVCANFSGKIYERIP